MTSTMYVLKRFVALDEVEINSYIARQSKTLAGMRTVEEAVNNHANTNSYLIAERVLVGE